ncbi:MAG TPA: hypothetical protein VM689_22595 [Aliidongia sp.]|nr:hypothetical protein [Aliidongia sp.]
MNADQSVGVAEAEPARDRGTMIAALRREALIAEAAHELGPERGDRGHAHACPARPIGEAVAGQRGHHDIEGKIAITGRLSSAGQKRDDLRHLGDAAGPAMGQDQRHASAPLRPLMDEMDTLAIDVGRELREAVQSPLGRAPIEAVPPMIHEAAQIGDVGAVLPADILGLIRPARPPEPFLEILDIRLGHGHAERLDRHGYSPSRRSMPTSPGQRTSARNSISVSAYRIVSICLSGYQS